MKKEWLLAAGVALVTLLVALGIVRWLAPQLLGLPADLQMVQVSKEVPPFYEGVFRAEDYRSREMMLKDPYTGVRAKPLFPETLDWGPNDILGFRNRSVPDVADVVIIGDSQTYGNNAFLEENWPTRLERLLTGKKPVVYSMAAGGWNAVQYLNIFPKALVFRPRVVVVAFYSGNDALESFRLAYSAEPWSRLRLDPDITASDGPPVKYPPPKSWWWEVNFEDGVKTTFIPRFRLASNMNHPAVKAGYAIMAETARLMSDMAGKAEVPIVFTIIPSKELVYAEKVRRDGIDAPDDYVALIKAEEANLRGLASQLAKLPDADYVDLLSPLQAEALKPRKLYPPGANGHPVAAGYDLIARTLTPAVNRHLPERKRGLFRIRNPEKGYLFILVKDDGVWYFGSRDIIKANGWTLDETPLIESRDIAGLPIRGIIGMADPMQFGPESVK